MSVQLFQLSLSKMNSVKGREKDIEIINLHGKHTVSALSTLVGVK